MINKVTFEPLKGRRYRVRKNGQFVIRDGKPLIVNEASIAATRSSLLNAGRKPPPALQPIGMRVEGYYSSLWKETRFSCPWCAFGQTRDGHFTERTACNYCRRSFMVVLPAKERTGQAEAEMRIANGHYSSLWEETSFNCPWCGDHDNRDGRFTASTTCRSCDKRFTVALVEHRPVMSTFIFG